MARSRGRAKHAVGAFNPADLVDAPEHHEFSRGLGILTWGTWDHAVRPTEERILDFLFAFPATEPTRNGALQLTRIADESYAPASTDEAVARFQSPETRTGSLPELLARYGLKLKDGPQYAVRGLQLDPFIDVARRRNRKLRVLYGSVDEEAKNMDAAKADYMEKLEAAAQIRSARKRMKEDIEREQGSGGAQGPSQESPPS